MSKDSTRITEQFLLGGGETGAIIRAMDWSNHSFGPPATWPQSLRTTLGIILNSKFPMFLWWGPDLICFYNDAYRPSLGQNGKHPSIMGAKAEDAWSEIWDIIKPLIDQVLAGEGATWSEDQLIPIYRNGKIEDVYWTFSYSPVIGEAGEIAGVLVTCCETTDKVLTYKSLEESKNQLQFAVDAAEIATWDINPATSRFTGNDRLKGWHGLDPGEEFDLEAGFNVVIEKDRNVLKEAITQALHHSSGGALDIEYTIVNPLTKQKRIVHAKGKTTFDENKIATRLNGTLHDVTQEVLARQKIEESNNRFRELVMEAPMGIVVLMGKDFIAETVNDKYLELIHRKREDFEGKSLFEAVPELKGQAVESLLNRVLASNEPYYGNEFLASIVHDGKKEDSYFNFVYKPLTENGVPSGIMVVAVEVTEMVKAKHALQESESYFRRMADSVPMMIWITNKDGLCTYVNKQWHQYTGQKFKDSLDYGWLNTIHVEDRGFTKEIFEESSKTFSEFQVEYRLKNAAGEYRWVMTSALPRFKPSNEFEGYIGTVIDIDDRKSAEEKIKDSEEKSRLAINSAELGIYEWIVGEPKVFISDRIAEIFNADVSGFVDRSIFISKFHPDDLIIHKKAHENIAATGTLDYEARVIWNDGSIHWIKNKGKVIEDSTKNTRKMLGSIMDITDIKMVSQALKISEARLAEAQRIAGIGNWEYNHVDKSFYCSDEVYKILATTPEEFIPNFNNLFRIIHPGDIKKISRVLSFTKKTGLPFNIDFRIITTENKTKYINSQGYVVLDDNQKIVKIIGTLQDITSRKLVEEELIEAKSISEKSLKYKEQFLANMSHEIRTPMNAIVGFTGLALKTPLQPDQKQYIEAIKTSGENLLVIINDILDFSKIEAGAIHFERIDFQLSELISTLTDLMLPKSVEKGIKLSVTMNPSVPNTLIGDPTRLNQILLNLVGNAIKFTEKGEVKIGVQCVKDNDREVELEFSVADTGIGIEPDMIEIIFNVFTQTSSDTTRKYGGSGLGLAIVKQFVEKQNGKVWVESELHKGSTFYFTLRFGKSLPDNLNNETGIKQSMEMPTTPIKILLVEDNKLNQLLASKALTDWNWEVEIADNGLIALEKVSKENFDVILMDIQLPEMDGYEATRYIRNTFDPPKANIPIIAVTAHAMQSEIAKCKEAGMDGYITKPFSPKMLYEGIMQVIKEKNDIRNNQTEVVYNQKQK